MADHLVFASQEEFRTWLEENHAGSGGVWLLFGKRGGPKTLTAHEALTEALCYGWIDGQMKKIDDTAYIKYFSNRRKNSKWSEKNKKLVAELEAQGRLTPYGKAKVDEAKGNGQWDAPKAPAVTEADIAAVAELLKPYEPAYTNFLAMSPSVRKTYTRAYLDAKTDSGRASRLAWMADRLRKNQKPM